jgi:uncharacterized protein YciI
MPLYLVLVMRRAQFDPAVVPLHHAFLDELRASGQLERSGPFGDKSGGAYLLHARDLEEATQIARRDPTHLSGGWDITVYEWQVG